MKKFTLLSTAILSLIMLGACASEKQKSSDTNPTSANTTDTSHDYSDNESSENNESSNEVPYYSSTNESSNESSIKDHDWREDYNSKGEYKPVDEMTQEEIKKELEETLNDALGLE
ncbi:hypothetical protein [Lactococcus lactis]|uniref:hypothetical protein n=1 Tax=Lactococcus lactis TaxID=1358 RepID=UPI0011111ADD|nr:hypothetical protein [Lactococcus lactis]MDQ7188791.1 hypothetical protein [Lactococcus lactis]MDT2858856.1 hypothetical protein [Lactococcus lactis]MDT2917979.1 hypothetical protein [Lactococcus lactis]